MKVLEFITGHVIYNLAYTYKFQLKTTKMVIQNIEMKISKIVEVFWETFMKSAV